MMKQNSDRASVRERPARSAEPTVADSLSDKSEKCKENYVLKVASPGFTLLCQLLKKGKKDGEALVVVNSRYPGIMFDLEDCNIIKEGIERGYL